jgi:hypothetical protein
MFKNPVPKFYCHEKAFKGKTFFTALANIVSNTDKGYKVFDRSCPHRMYPINDTCTGKASDTFECRLHGYSFNEEGSGLNNSLYLHGKSLTKGKSGILFENFNEPDHQWVKDVEQEKNLTLAQIFTGNSKGSWLWLTDLEADCFHIHKKGIHPELYKEVDIAQLQLINGDGWGLQQRPDGWWLCIYPYTFIEWESGCLAINTIIPDSKETEFGFRWMTQIYVDYDKIHTPKFDIFDLIFKQDVKAAEDIKGKYFPITTIQSELEEHSYQFGRWMERNKI